MFYDRKMCIRDSIVAGRGNIRGCEGPRNAVATGLAMACVTEE